MKENWGQTSRQLHLYWYEMFEKLVKWRNERSVMKYKSKQKVLGFIQINQHILKILSNGQLCLSAAYTYKTQE